MVENSKDDVVKSTQEEVTKSSEKIAIWGDVVDGNDSGYYDSDMYLDLLTRALYKLHNTSNNEGVTINCLRECIKNHLRSYAVIDSLTNFGNRSYRALNMLYTAGKVICLQPSLYRLSDEEFHRFKKVDRFFKTFFYHYLCVSIDDIAFDIRQ